MQGHTFIPNVVLPKWYQLSESHLQNERLNKIISNVLSISRMFLAFIDNLKCNAIQCNAIWCSLIRLLDGSSKRKGKKKSRSKELQLTQVINIYYLPKMYPAVDLIHFLYNVYRVGVIKSITVTEWLQSCIQGQITTFTHKCGWLYLYISYSK